MACWMLSGTSYRHINKSKYSVLKAKGYRMPLFILLRDAATQSGSRIEGTPLSEKTESEDSRIISETSSH